MADEELKQNSDITRGIQYGETEVKFKNEELAKKNSMMPIETTEWIFYSTYQSKHVARVRGGRNDPEIETEWFGASVLDGTGADTDSFNLKDTAVELVGIWAGIIFINHRRKLDENTSIHYD